MDLDQLKYFQALAHAKNFTKASEELSLSQPALSRSIARLEEEIGVPLFERKSRIVILNRYGQILHEHANRALSEIAEAQHEINDLVNPLQGTISLAFIQTLGFSFVPDLISNFKKQYPDVKFQLSQDTTNKILSQIEAAEIDIGFCSPQESMNGLSQFSIAEEELFLIVSTEHQLAGMEQIDLLQVADEPFVSFKNETALRDVIETLCQEVGFHPNIIFEGIDERTVAGLVGAKFGVALVPMTPELDQENLSIIQIKKPRCLRKIHTVWRKEGYMSPVVKQFKNFVERVMRIPD